MKTIFLVRGETGKYADLAEWTVCAYSTKSLALKHSKLAQAEAGRIQRTRKTNYDTGGMKNKYDEKMSMDYNGTTYCVESVKFSDKKIIK